MWKTVGFGAICAVGAFLYFLLTGPAEYRAVAEIKPTSDAKVAPAKPAPQSTAKPATETPVVVPKRRGEHHDAEFILYPSSEFQHIGPVSIRLKAVHPAEQTCDLVLRISQGHEWNQTGRINQPVPLVRGKRSTQLVIREISATSVSAYIGEAGTSH